MPTFLIYILIGSGLGAVLGYFGKLRSGGRPLMAHWQRGAAYGALLAAAVYVVSGRMGDDPTMNLSTANVKHIAETNFEAEVLQAKQPVVVDFYGTWCAPCQQLAPTVEAVAGQFAGRVKFVKVNYDEAPKLIERWQVVGIPQLIFFKSGRSVGITLGPIASSDLATKVGALLSTTVVTNGAVHP